MRRCFFADEGPCAGRLVKAHLIPKQRIRREVGAEHMWDDRTWVWVCGGASGVNGHHGQLDFSRTMRIPRARLPRELEEFAAEHGLVWSLERDYGVAA
jgi:hypothetical protein